MKYRYYNAAMNGRDWTALKAKYEPLLKYAGHLCYGGSFEQAPQWYFHMQGIAHTRHHLSGQQ